VTKNRFREQFARALATAFQQAYADKFESMGMKEVFDAEFIYDNLEKPKDARMGRFAFPVFRFSKLLGAKPPEIAQRVADTASESISSYDGLAAVTSAGGFINAATDFAAEAGETLSEILKSKSAYGGSDRGNGRTVLVEYSSPNIAKPFGIGHLRTTILGNSLRRIFKKLGFDVIGVNYLGDWGTQFGKMIVAWRRWGGGARVADSHVTDLLELYVRFHEEAEKDDSLNDEARLAFKMLEEGDPETVNLWEQFKKTSQTEFDRVYKLLGIEFDLVTGEAFLNDKMEPVIKRLEKAGLTSISEGALIVDLDDPHLPPCLLKKADGATLYATRDLAGLIYRWEKYKFEQSLYVVGTAQSDHFKQAFKVIGLLEDKEQVPPDERMIGRVKHIEFGWVRFGDQMLSTRRGNIIFLEDVINKAVDLAREKIAEKNPNLADRDETALMIGVGAVLYSQFSVRRQKDVNFDWDEVLSFEGETGPYLQYTHARLCSLLRNYPAEVSAEFDQSLLDKEEERRVVELLADFPAAVEDAARSYDPNIIAAHLIRLAGAFNRVYQRKDDKGRIDKIISDDANLSAARIALVESVRTVIYEGLSLLGIQAPQEM